MIFRKAAKEEHHMLYESGYREWPKGRTLLEYIQDNQKEETSGTRYVLVNEKNDIAASLILLCLKNSLYGIGSVVVEPDFRGKGLGKQLILKTIEKIKRSDPAAAFMLYSEIGTAYYEQMGFRALPLACQRFPQGICMIKSSKKTYSQFIKTKKVPDYF